MPSKSSRSLGGTVLTSAPDVANADARAVRPATGDDLAEPVRTVMSATPHRPRSPVKHDVAEHRRGGADRSRSPSGHGRQVEERGQEQQRGPRGPRLGTARPSETPRAPTSSTRGSRRRPRAAGSRSTARARSIDEAMRAGGVAVAVARQAGGDQRVVVRPDGAGVVLERVVARLVGADGPHAPARVKLLVKQLPSGRRRLRPRRARPYHSRWPMFEVRLSTWRFSPSSARAWQPARASRSRGGTARAGRGLALEARGERRIAPHLARQPRAARRRRRTRSPGSRRSRSAPRPARRQRTGSSPSESFQHWFTSPVAGCGVGTRRSRRRRGRRIVDPRQGGAGVGLERADELGVAGPALVLVEEDEEQRRGVGGPEVRRVRPLAEGGELAEAKLVEDLARLLLAEVVAHGALAGGEHAQGRGGEPGQVRQRLVAR